MDEHPFATRFDVHQVQVYRVLAHSQMGAFPKARIYIGMLLFPIASLRKPHSELHCLRSKCTHFMEYCWMDRLWCPWKVNSSFATLRVASLCGRIARPKETTVCLTYLSPHPSRPIYHPIKRSFTWDDHWGNHQSAELQHSLGTQRLATLQASSKCVDQYSI